MNDRPEIFIAFITLIGIFILTSVGLNSKLNSFKEQAVKHKCAKYNSVNGQFEWIRSK